MEPNGSDGSQRLMTFDLSLSESADSRSLQLSLKTQGRVCHRR